MECIRQTVNSGVLNGVLELPASLRDTTVDVIVLPARGEAANYAQASKRGSAFGCLGKYANSELIEQEKNAQVYTFDKDVQKAMGYS